MLANARGSVSTTVNLAQNALRNAQLAYDQAERDHKHLLDMKGWGYDVEHALKGSQVRLDNARTDLDTARRNASGASVHASESVIQAQKTLAEAQARCAALKKQPNPESVKAAQLSVEAARLTLQRGQADLAQVEVGRINALRGGSSPRCLQESRRSATRRSLQQSTARATGCPIRAAPRAMESESRQAFRQALPSAWA